MGIRRERELIREGFEAGRGIFERSEHCEHFGIFQRDWDWRYPTFDDYLRTREETARKGRMRNSSVRDTLQKHGLDDTPTQSGIDDVDLMTGAIRTREKEPGKE